MQSLATGTVVQLQGRECRRQATAFIKREAQKDAAAMG